MGARALWGRLEWRGLSLAVSGAAWISYGVHIAVQPRYGTVRGISVLLDLMPMWGWGVGWIVAGVVSLAYSVLPKGKDRAGLGAAIVPPLLWAVAYALGATVGGDPKAWGAIAPWASHAALILFIAAGTRPKRVVVVTHG